MEKISTNRRHPPFAVIWTAGLTVVTILYIVLFIMAYKMLPAGLELRAWCTQGVSFALFVFWQLTIIVISIELLDYRLEGKQLKVLHVLGRLLLSFIVFIVFTIVVGYILLGLNFDSEIQNENGTITVVRGAFDPRDYTYELYEREGLLFRRFLRPMRGKDDTDESLTLMLYEEIMRYQNYAFQKRNELLRKEREEAERQEREMWENHWEEQRREEEERIEQLYLEMEALDTYIKTEGDLAGIESSDSIHLEAEREMNARAQPYLVVYLEYVPDELPVDSQSGQPADSQDGIINRDDSSVTEDIDEENRTIIIERTLQYNRTTEQGDQFVYKERWHDSENRSLKDAELLNFFVVNPDTMEIMKIPSCISIYRII